MDFVESKFPSIREVKEFIKAMPIGLIEEQ